MYMRQMLGSLKSLVLYKVKISLNLSLCGILHLLTLSCFHFFFFKNNLLFGLCHAFSHCLIMTILPIRPYTLLLLPLIRQVSCFTTHSNKNGFHALFLYSSIMLLCMVPLIKHGLLSLFVSPLTSYNGSHTPLLLLFCLCNT